MVEAEEDEVDEDPEVDPSNLLPPIPRPNVILTHEDINTLPRDNASSRAPSNKKPNFCIATSFESTQSVPTGLNVDDKPPPAQLPNETVEVQLTEFNKAMFKLEGNRTYSGRIMRNKSFVQSSYERLSRQFRDDIGIRFTHDH